MARGVHYRERAKQIGSHLGQVVLNVVMVFLLLAAIVFVLWLNLFASPRAQTPAESSTAITTGDNADTGSEAVAEQPAPKAESQPPAAPTASETGQPMTAPVTPPSSPGVVLPKLIIPVAGVQPNQLTDTFNAARSEGRVHNALDIMAPQGTPVLAAANGLIRRLMTSVRGGTTIYQLGADGKTVYYYGHLQRYADGISEGKEVKQGEVIGYVGDTGNAGVGNYHLHFAMWLIADPKHFWDGENLNPFPLLHH